MYTVRRLTVRHGGRLVAIAATAATATLVTGGTSLASAGACGGQAIADPLIDHVNSAYLERSPLQQARDLADVDDYVLAHTVLVESLLKPVLEGCADPGQAAPAPAPMPGHGGMPAPQPAPAPAPPPAAPVVAPAA